MKFQKSYRQEINNEITHTRPIHYFKSKPGIVMTANKFLTFFYSIMNFIISWFVKQCSFVKIKKSCSL